MTGEIGPSRHEPYVMRISRLTVDKLGIKMYDRVSAVLAELIANSYDADAERVTITLPWNTYLKSRPGQPPVGPFEITISDDGHGMTASEVNTHYLTVGSDRRQRFRKDTSLRKQRPVMGRKGIGKLAPFGICETIEVISAGGEQGDRGFQVAHLVLSLSEILSDTDEEYLPTPGELDGTWAADHGTTIKLRDFHRKRVPSKEELDRQLAARFGLERSDWQVQIFNSSTHDGQGHVQGSDSFILGRLNIDVFDETRIIVDNRPIPTDQGVYLPVTGWVAYAKSPYKDPAMAGVRIFARGKIVAQTRDFGIGAGFTGEYKLRSYLVGEVHAEWLDDNEDLIRSDRQDIIWTSELGEAFSAWGKTLIKEVAANSESAIQQETWREYVEKSNLQQRLEQEAPGDQNFHESVTRAAKILVTNKDREALQDQDHVDRLTKLALSIGPHKSLLDALHSVAADNDNTLDMLIGLFDKARIAEMYSLGQVASERIAVVKKLTGFIEDGTTLEQPLQELLEQAPWILAPEWTPLGTNESLKRVRGSFEAWYKKKYGRAIVTTAINRERKEPDFVMLHDSGILWIVEIKRMNYHLSDAEYQRALQYLVDLEAFLDENPTLGDQFPIRRLTFVVDHIDRLSVVSTSSMDADRRVSRKGWHELLDDTLRAHRDFLARVAEMKASGTYI
ncbi:ATP-binding protein [Spongiactinospora sp. 9N601]|uniref:ATP-binding protein n=1 Tax=Spongiactinospora sp. 9N601 TaxID=3375149 RepID=UPI00379C98E9